MPALPADTVHEVEEKAKWTVDHTKGGQHLIVLPLVPLCDMNICTYAPAHMRDARRWDCELPIAGTQTASMTHAVRAVPAACREAARERGAVAEGYPPSQPAGGAAGPRCVPLAPCAWGVVCGERAVMLWHGSAWGAVHGAQGAWVCNARGAMQLFMAAGAVQAGLSASQPLPQSHCLLAGAG